MELDHFKAAGSVVKCASDGEETESGEARIGEARGRGEAEAEVEVKTGGEAEASGTGEAADARIRADRANAANIELAQHLCGAAGSVMSGLGEEATSEGGLGRGSGGEEGLGEGGCGEGQFQNFFVTAIGTSPPTNSLPQSLLTLHPNPSSGSTLHPPTYQPS